jgi:hypothetical protein
LSVKLNSSIGFAAQLKCFQPETPIGATMIAVSRSEWYQCHGKCPHNQHMLKISPMRQIAPRWWRGGSAALKTAPSRGP